MKIGLLTGGGDCPGLNAVIQAVVKRAVECGDEVIGFLDGYSGLINGKTKQLRLEDVKNIYECPLTFESEGERGRIRLEQFYPLSEPRLREALAGGADSSKHIASACSSEAKGVPVL